MSKAAENRGFVKSESGDLFESDSAGFQRLVEERETIGVLALLTQRFSENSSACRVRASEVEWLLVA